MIWFNANLVFLIVTIMAAIGLYVSWIPTLPAEIPIHFDENMVPDDVVSSSEFLWIFIFSQPRGAVGVCRAVVRDSIHSRFPGQFTEPGILVDR